MKKKLKADSVDELFEIVKAVQNGEDPEEYAKRKRAEALEAEREAKEASKRKRAEALEAEREAKEASKRKRAEALEAEREAKEAAKRKHNEEREAEEMAAGNAHEKNAEHLGGSDDADFEQMLEDDTEEEFGGLKTAVQKVNDYLNAVREFLAEKSAAKSKSRSTNEAGATASEVYTNEAGATASEVYTNEAGATASEVHTDEIIPAKSKEMKMTERTHELGSVHLADLEKEPGGKTRRRYGARTVSEESETIGQRILHSLHMDSSGEDQKEHSSAGKRVDGEKKTAGDEIDADSIDLDTVQILDRLLDVKTPERKETAEPTEPTTAADSAEPSKSSEAAEPTTAALKITVKSRYCVIAAVVLMFLVVTVAARMLYHTSQIQEKQKYVTADEGLTITVENQPAEWCSSYELKMKVSVKKGEISTIEINDTAVKPDDEGYVTVDAQSTPLAVTVTTESGTLAASVEIPMLDTNAPSVTADISGGQIVLTATDTRSGVSQIRYAVVRDEDWLQLPQYQQYSEAIPYEEDCLYYFYAVDQAGNCSTPVVSNMVTAESIILSENELTLYPQETAYVEAEVTPSNALLTNLQYESSNTEVVTVNGSGLVTAVAEGSALIKVTADGLDMATCTVNVVTEAVITVSAVGDCTLGTYKGSVTSTSFDTYYSMYGAAWFFQNVKEILENDDVTFANLEGPLTNATSAADKTYAFKGDPSYTEILLDGSVEVVTLANNHSNDYGSQGLADTKENLTEAGIDYCTGDAIAYQEISGVKVAFIGIYELATGLECETQVRETIAEAQDEGAKLIIVAFHWGSEKENYPDEIQQSLAHTAIDCGADLVVGHHPHVLQGIEKYNGKYIVYSLGNFCFGGNSNPSDKDTMIFRQTFTVTADGAALNDEIEIIPCTLSSASGYNDYRPTPATGTAADEIMERINEYSAGFGEITYTASTGL